MIKGKCIDLENGNSVFLGKKENRYYVMFETSAGDGETIKSMDVGNRTQTCIRLTIEAMRALAILYVDAEETTDKEVEDIFAPEPDSKI